MMKRGAGILHAISTLGSEAYEFVDFLAEAGQSYWQVLPIGPVGKTLSPYQSSSAFAGNPSLIDREAISRAPELYAPQGEGYLRFLEKNASWIHDFALYVAVHASQRKKPLSLWPEELRNPSEKTLRRLHQTHKHAIDLVLHEQYCFFVQWLSLRRYANHKGIQFIGDLPIYVFEDSAEFWLRRDIFDVDCYGRPASTAGVPPDAFSANGQQWNNPVYAWDKNPEGVFSFWRERLLQASQLYNGVRIDHFRAFADYYAIPYASRPSDSRPSDSRQTSQVLRPPDLHKGKWRLGPGRAFTDMIQAEFPSLLVIAEDLGILSKTAKTLMKECGLPGMRVLQFAFDGNLKNPHLPHNVVENSVCYTGTHDNNTLVGWIRSMSREERRVAMEYLGVTQAAGLQEALLAAALMSKARITIIPIQDWLGLGAVARINKPGTVGRRNWKWRLPKDTLNSELALHICFVTRDLCNR